MEFLIYYKQKDFDDKVKVDFGYINEINLEIVEKIYYNIWMKKEKKRKKREKEKEKKEIKKKKKSVIMKF